MDLNVVLLFQIECDDAQREPKEMFKYSSPRSIFETSACDAQI